MSKTWLDICLELEKGDREKPINVAHLKLLLLISENEEIRTDDLLAYFPNEKPTLISRINFLIRKGLINKLPLFNRGGNGNPNYYTTTTAGKEITSMIGL
jgi:DNA-binding MarR family transcriptional regulator